MLTYTWVETARRFCARKDSASSSFAGRLPVPGFLDPRALTERVTLFVCVDFAGSSRTTSSSEPSDVIGVSVAMDCLPEVKTGEAVESGVAVAEREAIRFD